MRLCRFQTEGETLLGFFDDTRVIPIAAACEAYAEATDDDLLLASGEDPLELLPPLGEFAAETRKLFRWVEGLDVDARAEISISIDEVQRLVPILMPNKIVLLAGNYAKHVQERGGIAAERAETFPYLFLKPPSTTLTNPGDPIVIPAASPDHVDWECELGVVIGRECRNVAEADALSYVAAYTIVNDITDRKFTPNPDRKTRERDKFFDWLHGKWHDTFCPMGPCILSADAVADPQALRLTLTVNGEVKQDGSTAQMIFPVAAVIAFLSQFVTLEPGDVISTGTPAGVGFAHKPPRWLRVGDEVVVRVQGIGALSNPVVAEA